MKNQELKQKAIQDAYGEYYEVLKEFINEDGWCNWWKANKLLTGNDFDYDWNSANSDRHKMRPKSIAGIGNNRGWFRIETDGSNLPVEGKFRCGMKFYDADIFTEEDAIYNHIEVLNAYHMGLITHYRPVNEHLKPVY